LLINKEPHPPTADRLQNLVLYILRTARFHRIINRLLRMIVKMARMPDLLLRSIVSTDATFFPLNFRPRPLARRDPISALVDLSPRST